jgi:hypothetical protein
VGTRQLADSRQYFADGGAIVSVCEPSKEKHMSKDYDPNLIGFFNLDRLPEHDKGTMTQRVISGEKGMAVWVAQHGAVVVPQQSIAAMAAALDGLMTREAQRSSQPPAFRARRPRVLRPR